MEPEDREALNTLAWINTLKPIPPEEAKSVIMDLRLEGKITSAQTHLLIQELNLSEE